jgi:hypothetical protein
VFRQLLMNYVTQRAHDDVFLRLARRFYLAAWASAALVARDAASRCVAPRRC